MLAWSTDEPTTAEGMVRWCSADGTETVSPFSSGPAREHRVAVPAPDPSAIGWGYVVVSGASVPYAPISFTVPPDSAAAGLPADAPEPVPELPDGGGGTSQVTLLAGYDPGEPDSLSNPRRFVAGGPPVTGCFQNDYDTDYFSLTVPPTGYPIEVEFEGFPNLVLRQIYSPQRISMWLSGPTISGGYAAPSGTYPFSVTNYGPAMTNDYAVTGYIVTSNPDPYEPNSFACPAAWPSDSETILAYIQSNGDTDYYWLDLEAGKTIVPSIPDSHLLGAVTISWRSGSYWYARDLRSGPFVAPVTTRYIITVSPRSYGYGITASCAHHPYTIGLGGLYPPAPVITGPAEDSRVAPLRVTVSWTFTAPDGSTQVGYRIQIASDADFEHLVADQSVESTAGSHVLDLPSCGEHFARVKVLTDRNQWSAWSKAVAFHAELATITAYPDTYCATELGPGKDAYFSVAALQPCDVAWKVADTNGHAVYTGSLSLMPGEHTLTWPGVLVASSEYSMPFTVVLAPPGRYVFTITAVDPAHPTFYSFGLVEFSVTW